jgi:hypothetical protein
MAGDLDFRAQAAAIRFGQERFVVKTDSRP